MSFQEVLKKDVQIRCEEAYAKVIAYQEKLNATITPVDPSEQLTEVKTGKLAGIPIALKDNVSTKGIRTTAASNILDNYVPVFDATIAKKLKEAGAVVVSKAGLNA